MSSHGRAPALILAAPTLPPQSPASGQTSPPPIEEYGANVNWGFSLFPDDERVGRGCGCTDTQACPGGCYWFDDGLPDDPDLTDEPDGPLCSNCALANEPVS